MKFYFLIIIIYMTAVSCKTNHQEKLIYGKWEMLTVRSNDTIFLSLVIMGIDILFMIKIQ